MQYTTHYPSPIGNILLTADTVGLTGLYFEGQKHFPKDLPTKDTELPVFEKTTHWLDLYFSGEHPSFTPPLHLTGTNFQMAVWALLLKIPYGKTTSYSALSTTLSAEKGVSRMSAQAVGGAVGHNPISIIVPCHRVLGIDGSLTGYAGGLERKQFLLALEGSSTDQDRHTPRP